MSLSEAPEEICICGHSHLSHGWGHPLLRSDDLKPHFASQIQRHQGRCLKCAQCPKFTWARDINDEPDLATEGDPLPVSSEPLYEKVAGHAATGSGF